MRVEEDEEEAGENFVTLSEIIGGRRRTIIRLLRLMASKAERLLVRRNEGNSR